MIAFRFYLAAPIRRTVVLFFTSKTSVNRRSDFLALRFLTIMGVPGVIGLLSVNLSVLETIQDSILALKCSLSLHFPEDLYNVLMFSRHICLYIAQLL